MKKKYPVLLSKIEREELKRLIAAGTAPARKLTHARILLKADESPEGAGWVDERVADAVEVSQPTVARVRKQYFEEGMEAALNRRPPNREYQRKLDGEQEAHLIALACSEPPEGRARWSLRLLADKLVELEIVEDVSYQTVRRTLKKRPQAPPKTEAVVDRARGERRVRLGHGGRVGSLHPTLRFTPSSGVHGRDLQATAEGHP
jgi:transposase